MDRAPQTRSRGSHASFVSARCYKSFPRALPAAAIHFTARIGGKGPMNQMLERSKTRRRFLKMLGASPLIAGSSMLGSGLATLLNAAPLEEKHFLGWLRSEERRVGKECRSRWGSYHMKRETCIEEV